MDCDCVSGMKIKKSQELKEKIQQLCDTHTKNGGYKNVKILHRAETKTANLMYQEKLDNLTLKS